MLRIGTSPPSKSHSLNSTPNKTRATVSFRNAGQPVSVALDLVMVNNDWRISDITWQHDGKAETLRGIYKH